MFHPTRYKPAWLIIVTAIVVLATGFTGCRTAMRIRQRMQSRHPKVIAPYIAGPCACPRCGLLPCQGCCCKPGMFNNGYHETCWTRLDAPCDCNNRLALDGPGNFELAPAPLTEEIPVLDPPLDPHSESQKVDGDDTEELDPPKPPETGGKNEENQSPSDREPLNPPIDEGSPMEDGFFEGVENLQTYTPINASFAYFEDAPHELPPVVSE